MADVDQSKVRALLQKLTTDEGRAQFVQDPDGHLAQAGITVPPDVPRPQNVSELRSKADYQSAIDSLDAGRFGDEHVPLDSPDLAEHVMWFRVMS